MAASAPSTSAVARSVGKVANATLAVASAVSSGATARTLAMARAAMSMASMTPLVTIGRRMARTQVWAPRFPKAGSDRPGTPMVGRPGRLPTTVASPPAPAEVPAMVAVVGVGPHPPRGERRTRAVEARRRTLNATTLPEAPRVPHQPAVGVVLPAVARMVPRQDRTIPRRGRPKTVRRVMRDAGFRP